ncbi:uncharacterized protein LOC125943204 [Dermacentor silvarum]|uniref:uncharacterized protein LOC125943204 n=1 Tax=Dermacentor silvarum TaxID=543639 RepID=UPI0021011C0B|nr:uncharacterized protein LOC125943204 [Dermacentor silvarum]
MQAFTCVAASLVLSTVSSANRHCGSGATAASFDYEPDAWKVIQQSEPKFHLMFLSRNTLRDTKYKCLATSRTDQISDKKWQRKLFYSTFSNDTELTLSTTLGIKKRRKCSIYDDAITVWNDNGLKAAAWTSEVIYADHRYCILLKSKYLGYEVWAATIYLEEHKEIPYICVMLYEIYSGIKKYWVYDWEDCPSRRKKTE